MKKNRGAMATVGNPGWERLILLMNNIQDICTRSGTKSQLDLPQIAVIGSQSAGKSSVLEAFVGRDFLPRGSGIVTRCPLNLQLINTPNGQEEYGEFLHLANKKFKNFAEIRVEIENETLRKAGANKDISNVPINLHIYSPNVLNLTLVDLPGITKIPVGDQPADIERKIRKMITDYISKENCLILAVSEANVDLARSEALKLAKEVDPKGIRTIGVITKLDLMDDGTDARKILENKVIPLRRGYIGVVNRSQKSIDDKRNIAKALEDERDFFMQKDCYSEFIDRSGIPYLQKMLNKSLAEHIRDKLPGLRDTLFKRVIALKKGIDDYEKSHPTDVDIVNEVLRKVMYKLESDFKRELGCLGADAIDTDRVTSGAKIRNIYRDFFPREIAQIEVDVEEIRRKILRATDNLYGKDSIMDFPFKAFEAIVQERIPMLKPPIEKCVDLVIKELMRAVELCTKRIADYPVLRSKIENTVLSFIRNNSETYKKNILVLIEMQSAYMNTKHDDFVGNRGKQGNEASSSLKGFTSGTNGAANDAPSPFQFTLGPNATNGDLNLDYHFKQVMSYMQIVEKTTVDMIPKAITFYIIQNVEKFINVGLSNLAPNITELMAADPVSYEDNEEKKKMCKNFEAILEEIDQVDNF